MSVQSSVVYQRSSQQTQATFAWRANVPRSANASRAATPSLYVCHVENILGSVPMMPYFVGDNTQPTIPYRFRIQRGRAGWAADTRPDAGNGSRLYELNLCMWRYGLGQERKVSILGSMEALVKTVTVREARARAGETVKRQRLGMAPLPMLSRDSRQFASCFAPVRAACSRCLFATMTMASSSACFFG